MAYTQKPGRGNSPKTGNGIPKLFNQSPMRQEDPKKAEREKNIKTWYEAKRISSSKPGYNKLSEREQGIETGATLDSLHASRPKDSYLYTQREREKMGNEAANKTRKINESDYTVERGEMLTPKGYKSTYTKKKIK
jgi:hypothetical protein